MIERIQIPVDEFTSPAPFAVPPTASLESVAEIMAKEGIRHIPVTNDDIAIGIISDRDIKVLTRHTSLDNIQAQSVMTPEPYHTKAQTPLNEVVFEMSKRKIGSAIITDASGKITGIFTVTDALNALIEVLRGDFPMDQAAY